MCKYLRQNHKFVVGANPLFLVYFLHKRAAFLADEAISDFRDALDQAIANRKTAVETAKNNYLAAYQAAIDKAKADCAAGIDPAKVRDTLQVALKAAREKFNSDKQAIEKLNLKPLVEARQQAFKEALDYFKKAMQEARDKLKAALGL